MNGRRLLFPHSRPDTHRGRLARPGGHRAPVAAATEAKPDAPVLRPEFPFSLRMDSSVSDQVETRAVAVLARATRFAPRPILYGRLAFRTERGRAVALPAAVTASLDVSGRIVTVHASAETPPDALDLLERRLRRSLDRLDASRRAERRKAGRTRLAPPGGTAARRRST